MKNLYQWALTLFAMILLLPLNSCSGGSGRSKVEYIPFRETQDGQWGMISPDGKVLFREEFNNEPTLAREGRFFVRNDKGLWEMYTAEAKPEKIGGEYTSASSFNNGRAVVAEANEPVKIFDTDGKTIKILDKINDKVIESVSAFHCGIAYFKTTDSLTGAIDREGNCIIEPSHLIEPTFLHIFRENGLLLAIPAQYSKVIRDEKGEMQGTKIRVLDRDGKEINQLSGDNYICMFYGGDKIIAWQNRNGKIVSTILDSKGNQLLEGGPVSEIMDVEGENFTYCVDKRFGLMNLKGETLIHAQYSNLRFDGDGLLIATFDDDNGRSQCKIIDLEGNQVGDEIYSEIIEFKVIDGKHTIAQRNDGSYVLIDLKGMVLPKLPDMVEMGHSDGNDWVSSNTPNNYAY